MKFRSAILTSVRKVDDVFVLFICHGLVYSGTLICIGYYHVQGDSKKKVFRVVYNGYTKILLKIL